MRWHSCCGLQLLPFDSACAAMRPAFAPPLEAAGTLIGPHDTLIAATALRNETALVTRNTRKFSRVPGLQCLNWHIAA